MAQLLSEQRDRLYQQAAHRVGLHAPILAALAQVHDAHLLPDGEPGLGIAPAYRVSLERVNSLLGQIDYAANTLRSLYQHCLALGWKPADLWHLTQGRYSDRFLQAIANGFVGQPNDPLTARLEVCDAADLQASYCSHIQAADQHQQRMPDWASLEVQLRHWVGQAAQHYWGLSYQRSALLELTRLWHRLDSPAAAIAHLTGISPDGQPTETISYALVDTKLLQFLGEVTLRYNGYPHQREAVLRAIQHWRQLASRSQTVASLQADATAALPDTTWDAALIAASQQIWRYYQGTGSERNALVVAVQAWHGLETKSSALLTLGLPPDLFSTTVPTEVTLTQAAQQLDRALLQFVSQIPLLYQALPAQRSALLQLVQRWREIGHPTQTLLSLVEDLQQMGTAPSPQKPSVPRPTALRLPSSSWRVSHLDLLAPIVPQGSLTWADATQAGIYLPPNQTVVEAIIHMATQIQPVCNQLQHPLQIMRWYCPSSSSLPRVDQHGLGDAIAFYCPGLTAAQLYWFLDPWWPGGLGRYHDSPLLCYVDIRLERVRFSYDQSLNFTQ